jgi:hypothetical protein
MLAVAFLAVVGVIVVMAILSIGIAIMEASEEQAW